MFDDAEWIADYLNQPLGEQRSFPLGLANIPLGSIAQERLNLKSGILPSPVLVLRDDALEHNIGVMADYCELHGVSIAPHAKTTMAPLVIRRQLTAGAWGMTAASWRQAEVLRTHGVGRVIVANQLIDPRGIQWAAEVIVSNPDFDLLVLVDSVEGVNRLQAALMAHGGNRPLAVLLEVGIVGGRSGVRDTEAARQVIDAVGASTRLQLVGVECFEGIIGPGREHAAQVAVDELLERVIAAAEIAEAMGRFREVSEVVLTAGGSVFFDRVIAAFDRGRTRLRTPVRTILRSGCYVTHDSGVYDSLSPFGSQNDEQRLRPALELWSTVLSRPEPTLAILDFGKRDAPFDSGFPVILHGHQVDGGTTSPVEGTVTAMHDQHAVLEIPAESELAVGDRMVLGISHPCTAFDRWRALPLVDAQDNVIAAIPTHF